MKTLNKTLLMLAIANFESDLKQYEYLNESYRESEIKTNYNNLLSLKNALLKGNYYTRVNSVATSGMSRIIEIKYVENNTLLSIDSFVYKLAGCDKNQRISGCGMDMLFAAQYNLFQALCPNHKYQSAMVQYRVL